MIGVDEMLAEARQGWEQIGPDDLEAEFAADALIVDIRPVDHRRRDGELDGAVIVDRNVLEWRLDPACDHRLEQRDEYRAVPHATTGYDRRIVVVCSEGYQSSLAVANLRRLGLRNVTDLAGGYQALLATP